jgi:membrane-associated phospholipid phosphatase
MRSLLLHQRRRLCASLSFALAAAPFVPLSPLAAQQAKPSVPAAAPRPVVTWHDARLLGAFALASGAVMPADRAVQRLMQRDWVQRSPFLTHTADAFNAYGSPGVFVGSIALYGAGWVTGRPDVSRLGMRASEAIMLSGIVTGGLKGIAGRARPYASPQQPGNWSFLGGTHDDTRQSFPSGHSTAVFAFATAMDYELRASHPDLAHWASPALYGAAALTGYARMHADAHWASDVVMGAGIGIVSGLIVSRFHADRPGSWLDRHFLPRAR